MSFQTPHEICSAIQSLTVEELIELKRLLGEQWWDEGGAGVREPREPAPVSPGDAIAQALPEDYWETAE